MTTLENLFSRSLMLPPDALVYQVSRVLARIFRDRFILETEDPFFDLTGFVDANQCRLKVLDHAHAQFESNWTSLAEGARRQAKNAFFDVHWQGNRLIV